MSQPNEPTWVREGNDVALIESNGTVEFIAIERLTATQLHLVGGRKFNRARLRELPSDNGFGAKTNRGARLVDPTDEAAVTKYAQQQLSHVDYESSVTTYGSGATIHRMSPQQVRDELDRLAKVINAARMEVDRRAGL